MNNIFLYKRFIGVKKINGHSGVNFSFKINENIILVSQKVTLIKVNYINQSERIPSWATRQELFHSMKQLGVFVLPPEFGMLVLRRVTPPLPPPPPPLKFAGTHLDTWAERGTMRVKCLVQKNTTQTGLLIFRTVAKPCKSGRYAKFTRNVGTTYLKLILAIGAVYLQNYLEI